MSTRCQILFRTKDAELLTYKHHDGYPDGTIPLLRRYYRWMPRHELEYFTATWFYYVKRRYEKTFLENRDRAAADRHTLPMETQALGRNHGVALSYGICADGRLHGDIEHVYVVDLGREVVAHYSIGFGTAAETPDELMAQCDPEAVYALAPDGYGDPDELTPVETADAASSFTGSTRQQQEVRRDALILLCCRLCEGRSH